MSPGFFPDAHRQGKTHLRPIRTDGAIVRALTDSDPALQRQLRPIEECAERWREGKPDWVEPPVTPSRSGWAWPAASRLC